MANFDSVIKNFDNFDIPQNMVLPTCVVLCHILLTFVFQLGVLQKCYVLFTSKQLKMNSTPTFLLFFYYLTLVSSLTTVYCIYVLVYWRPVDLLYNEATMYFIGIIPYIFLISNPIFQFGLCLERCFIVAFPYRYLDKWKQSMCSIVFITCLFIIILISWLDGFIWIPTYKYPPCQFLSCVISVLPQNYIMAYKFAISVIECFAAIILGFLIKRKLASPKNSKNKNKNIVVLVVVVSTIICELTPNLADYIVKQFTGLYLVNIIGPYRTTLSSFNIFISAILYTHVFNKAKGVVSTIQTNPSRINVSMAPIR